MAPFHRSRKHRERVERCRNGPGMSSTVFVSSSPLGLVSVIQGKDERLPFLSGSFDGVICKVVLPYTNERTTIGEIGRVLRLAGTAYVVSHGAGYYLRYFLRPPRFTFVYMGRAALLNT